MNAKVLFDYLLEGFYILSGIIMLITVYFVAKDSKNKDRITTAIFWGILGVIFIFGKIIPPALVGGAIVIMGILTLLNKVKPGNTAAMDEKFKEEQAKKIGSKIFIPSVTLAIVAFVFAQATFKLSGVSGQVAIGVSALAAVIIALVITKANPSYIAKDGDRLLRQVGPASILPQLLAALGSLFTAAGVGDIIAKGISSAIPQGNIWAGIIAYCLGMAVFTIIMGNGFAAFAVITAGIGIPFVFELGANPAVAGALALTAGFCGTLLTPMAANFNVVPAALLETKNKNRVIMSQAPIALIMLVIHIFLMYFLAF
ncbi:DUF979 domain-containing protein [Clostridium polynesiense]|uniref:DUF979 domain-containing protein n=1 Tax=Clostridium polynesiense TaxID=1325933 RepID=UPI00058CD9A2|nr:DUF979 domain-containing protein [Clostridium polynesiense]